jgi:UDP-N-acetylmuramoyl-tripeptide--D-alanyl-D-alanine ligase
MTTILTFILTLLARCYRWRYRPTIIAVTGNTGKTTTKEAVAAVLRTAYRVRASTGNLNNELGVPLTIIGDVADEYYRTGGTPWFWFRTLVRAKWELVAPRSSYPQVLVLEYGADRPGDIKKLVASFPPDVSVVTAVGQVPVHVEFFASPQALAEEKAHIIRHLTPEATAVLNADDLTVLEMRSKTRAHVVTYGSGKGADVKAGPVRVRTDGSKPTGIQFDIDADGSVMPVHVSGAIGSGLALSAGAAVAVGRVMRIGLAQACEALSHMHTPPGRLRIINGIKESVIIDDTYNASPAAVHLAIDAVRPLEGRKILVLGDMRELGEHAPKAHQAIGSLAATVADLLVCVGAGGVMIADAASNQMALEQIIRCGDSKEAGHIVQRLIRPGDVVLVKGSQGVRMERVVVELMAQPQRAHELLVRQSARWLAKE